MFGFHPTELIFVLIIALIIFGPKRLPEIGSAIGKGLREFRKATSEVTDQLAEPATPPPLPTSQPSVSSPQPVMAKQESAAETPDAPATE
jgi:sec-independent protein translocase protein TatA